MRQCLGSWVCPVHYLSLAGITSNARLDCMHVKPATIDLRKNLVKSQMRNICVTNKEYCQLAEMICNETEWCPNYSTRWSSGNWKGVFFREYFMEN